LRRWFPNGVRVDAAEAKRVGDLLKLRRVSGPRRAVRHIVGKAPEDTREAALEIAASIIHHRGKGSGICSHRRGNGR
jgi:hypothetical protein